MGENSAGRQDEPLSRPFLDPQAPSDLDSSLHVDLGVSEPAHVLRRLGESSPKDKRTCRKMRSEAGVGTPPLSPLFIRMLILYSSSPYPHVRPQSSGPGPNRLGPGGAGRKGPHRPAAGRPPGPGWARAQGGGDPRLPGRGCRGPRTRGRRLGGARRLGCRPSVGRLLEPPLETGTRSGPRRAMGLGDWCGARAAAAFAASCTRDPRPGGTRRWSHGV